MTFEEVKNNYPLNRTLAGDYYEETCGKLSEDDFYSYQNNTNDAGFGWIVVDTFNNIHRMCFAAFFIKGYLNTTGDEDGYIPITNSESGWEKIYTSDTILAPNDPDLAFVIEKHPTANFPEQMRELAMYRWDSEAYVEGRVFRTMEELETYLEGNK